MSSFRDGKCRDRTVRVKVETEGDEYNGRHLRCNKSFVDKKKIVYGFYCAVFDFKLPMF